MPPVSCRARRLRRGVERLPADSRLGAERAGGSYAWDEGLGQAMAAADVAVHEEAIIDLLLAGLR